MRTDSISPQRAALLLLGLILSSAVWAQTLPNDSLSEVVVTAERFASTESKTPISMEVLSQSELATKGIGF